ncbi:MAG: class I SAM-dependent methyltransferase [Saprospiraceae bacterium]|nr:class I SAM-dependent methyltransferase [Saprospiraceae bacterium]
MSRIILIIQFFTFCSFHFYCFGQNEHQIKVLKALETKRNKILSDSIFFKEILNITSKYKSSANFPAIQIYKELSEFYVGIDTLTRSDFEFIKSNRFETYQDEDDIRKEMEFLVANSDFFWMLYEGILSSDFPFRLNIRHYMLQEILTCNIDSNQSIAEIGAGTGYFAFLLNIIFHPLKYHLNELDISKIRFYKKIKGIHQDSLEYDYSLIKGEEKKTNLKGRYDKIIIRNTFHHFSDKKKMLDDIKQHLNPKGEIIVIEVFKEDASYDLKAFPGAYSCYHQLSKKKFLKYFEKSNLQMLSNTKVQNRSIFVFKQNEK